MTLGTINTLVLALSAITTLMAWVACKMRQFGKFKFFHACTLLLALSFLCIKMFEYHDHLTHYEIHLADGRIADGHMMENNPAEDYVQIDGRYVNDESDLIDLRAQKNIQETEIKIPRAEIKDMESYGPWHNTYLALYFTLTALHALHIHRRQHRHRLYLGAGPENVEDRSRTVHQPRRGVRPVLAFCGLGLDIFVSRPIFDLKIYERFA